MTETKFETPELAYRYLFENASDAIWVHDMKGNIVYANKAFEKLTGYTGKGLTGINIKQLLPNEESQEIAREVRRRLLNGQELKQPYEQHFVRRDGTIGICMMATSLVISNGEVKGFQHIARDATEERQLQENTRFYVQEIIRAQEDERKRIARELHDDVSPSLLLLTQRLDAMTSCPRPKLTDPLRQQLEGLRCQTIEALESLRRIAQDLRPRILDDLGLIAALEWIADDLIRNHGIETKVEVLGKQQNLPSEVQLLLFRIAQEALNNIRKHAQASMALVTVEFTDGKIILTITDNGKGFELPKGRRDLAGTGKFGLAGMQERAQLMGGQLTLKAQPDKGTSITVEVPVQDNLSCPLPREKGREPVISNYLESRLKPSKLLL